MANDIRKNSAVKEDKFSVSMTRDPWARNFSSIFEKNNNGEFVLRAWFELLCLPSGCGRRFCCCRCLVVGMGTVVAIVLCVAVA